MADGLRPFLTALVLLNLAFVQLTGTVQADWMAPLWLLALAAPWLCRLQERLLYRLLWNVGVLGAFAWLVRHALTTGLLHMLEDGLLLAALCQVHLLNNVGRRQRPDLLFFNSFLIAFVTSFFSTDLAWSLVFLGYVTALVPALQLFAVLRVQGTPPGVVARVVRDSVPRTLVVLGATALVFALWPRDFRREGWIDHALRMAGAGNVAFDEPIRLGGDRAVSQSDRELARITPEDGRPESVPAHWRGATYVEFDGSAWSAYQVADFGTRRATDQPWQADQPHRWRRPASRTGACLRIRLLDDNGERLFTPLSATTVELIGASVGLLVDPKGDGVVAFQPDAAGPPVDYQVTLGTLDPRRRLRVNTAAELRLRSVSLADLPKTLLDLAQTVRATLPANADAHAIATGCAHWLQENRRYALPGAAGAARNLGEFVLGTGAGHCEYFATTLALMLRVLAIPCRVVGGYLASEWSEATREVIVRERHAHAWVEALLPDGWVTLDATPASGVEATPMPSWWGSFTAMLADGWARVTGFDGNARAAALAWVRALPGRTVHAIVTHPWASGLLIGAVAALWWWWRTRRDTTPMATRLLRQALRSLHLQLQPGETPRELLARASTLDLPPARLQVLATAVTMHETMRYRPHGPEESR